MTQIELTQELKEIEAAIARNLNTLTTAQQLDCYCKASYAQGFARGAGATVEESYFI